MFRRQEGQEAFYSNSVSRSRAKACYCKTFAEYEVNTQLCRRKLLFIDFIMYSECDIIVKGQSTITGLDWWTGLVDSLKSSVNSLPAMKFNSVG